MTEPPRAPCRFISELSTLFCWSICLSLCHYPTVDFCSFVIYFETRKCDAFNFLKFLLKIALAIRSLLCFHMNFKVVFSISEKDAIGILIGIALNL